MTMTDEYRYKQFLHWKGTSTPLLNFTHLAFCTKYDNPTEFDNLASNNSEIDRVSITGSNISYTAKRFIIDITIATTVAVCPTSIITDLSVDKTIITLTSITASAFKLGDRIEIPTSQGYVERKIIAKNSNIITVNQPTDATISGEAHVKVSHVAILCNSNNTPAPSTDLVFKWFKRNFYKDNTGTRLIKLQYDFLG